MRLGFVGVGAINEAVAHALATGPLADQLTMVLSPRGQARSQALAARFAQMSVVESNQAVLDASDIVFLGVLPSQLDDVCAELTFRPDHIVVSAIAGRIPSEVAKLVAPASQVCQVIPLPVIALHAGPVVVSPGLGPIVSLFQGCGEVVVIEDETKVKILSCASAAMSTFFQFQNTVIDWIESEGLSRETAVHYMTSLFNGLSTEAMNTDVAAIDAMPGEHETPGGLNEHIRRSLTEAGMFAELTKQMDYIYRHKKLTKSDD